MRKKYKIRTLRCLLRVYNDLEFALNSTPKKGQAIVIQAQLNQRNVRFLYIVYALEKFRIA